MIIQKEIIVKITNKNKKFYINKGYSCGDKLCTININDLPNGSHYKINVKCDNCGNIKESVYKNYYKITNGLTSEYYCIECKHIKTKITNLNNYGVTSSFLREDTKLKIKNKLINNYGVSSPLKSIDIKNKMKLNLIEKYNFNNVSKIKSVKLKKQQTLQKTWIQRLSKNYPNLKILNGDYDNKTLNIECDLNKNHTFNTYLNLLHNRLEFNNIQCTLCNPINSNRSSYEDLIINYIESIYKGEIIKNSRNIINPYEIDIYLPEFKLGIDINGLHWHNELKKDKNYHRIKTDLSIKNGIQLIQFYEDDIIHKLNIIKSMIKNKLNLSNNIFVENCTIKEIDNTLSKDFLNKNHIQGYISSTYKIGLIYNNELVSLMMFKKRKFNKVELTRYCDKLDYNIIGGISKILKYFIKNYNIENITTFIDKSYSDGIVYKKLGFIEIKHTPPNCYYIVNRIRKRNCKNNYDLNKIKIHDSGNIKFQYHPIKNTTGHCFFYI